MIQRKTLPKELWRVIWHGQKSTEKGNASYLSWAGWLPFGFFSFSQEKSWTTVVTVVLLVTVMDF